MDLNRIHEILIISQTGSIKKAAELLSVSYATLLARLNHFEKTYDIQLFLRSRSNFRLSEFAERLLPVVTDLIENYRLISAHFDANPSTSSEKLHEFLVLGHALNFSKAAEALFVSQSMLSKHLKELEQEFHCSLCVRSTHGVSLTPEGSWLAKQLPEFLAICDNLESLLTNHDHLASGRIRLGCALEFTYAKHVQTFLERFQKRHPEIEIEFEAMPSGTGPNDPGRYDFILTPCEYIPLSAGITMVQIDTHSIYAAVSQAHALAGRKSIALNQLSGETILTPFASEPFGPYARNYQAARKHTGENVSCASMRNLSSAIFRASISDGIILVPKYAKNLLPPSLTLIKVTDKDARFDEYLYYQTKTANPAAQIFRKEFLSRYSQRV